MSSDEYKEFLEWLFHEHMEKKLRRASRMWDANYFFEGWPFPSPRLTKALRALRFIDDYFDSDEELADSLKEEMINGVVDSIEDGIHENNRVIVGTEIVDVIQDYFSEIVDGLSSSDFPKADFELLRQSGSPDPKREISAYIHIIKSRKDEIIQDGKKLRFSSTLKKTTKIVSKCRIRSGNSNDKNITKPKRKWFKGLGSIGSGTLISLTDFAAACGIWPVPLSPETASFGAVASITTGVGMILVGVGELRGE